MRIALNLRPFVEGHIGGLENVIRHIVPGIVRRHEVTAFGRSSELSHIAEFAAGSQLIPLDKPLETCFDPSAYDLLFCPLLTLEPPRPGIACAVLIPDLQHEFFPEFFSTEVLAWRRAQFHNSAATADVVFTVSEYSRKTICAHLGIAPEKVVILDHGVADEFRSPIDPKVAAAVRSLNLPPKFILYPANFWGHKNHIALLKAARILVDRGRTDFALVLTGQHRLGSDDLQTLVAEMGLESHVRLLGYLSPPLLAGLYRRAAGLAFISQFEGFGIPLLEAFHSGTPVVASRIATNLEVCGQAALFVDERDPADIARGLAQLLDDNSLGRRLALQGHERAARYSWSNAVDAILRTFETLASSARPPDTAPARSSGPQPPQSADGHRGPETAARERLSALVRADTELRLQTEHARFNLEALNTFTAALEAERIENHRLRAQLSAATALAAQLEQRVALLERKDLLRYLCRCGSALLRRERTPSP